MPQKSRYTLIIEGLSTYTRSHDIRLEMERYGDVTEVERDIKERCALVQFKREDDARYAWKKAEGTKMDGRTWQVDYANTDDFSFFNWKFDTDYRSPSPNRSMEQ